MVKDIDYQTYIGRSEEEDKDKSDDVAARDVRAARVLLWKNLRDFPIRAVVWPGSYTYLQTALDYVKFITSYDSRSSSSSSSSSSSLSSSDSSSSSGDVNTSTASAAVSGLQYHSFVPSLGLAQLSRDSHARHYHPQQQQEADLLEREKREIDDHVALSDEPASVLYPLASPTQTRKNPPFSVGSQCCIINSLIYGQLSIKSRSVIENCHFRQGCVIGSDSLVSGVDADHQIVVNDSTCFLQVRDGDRPDDKYYIIYGIRDDLDAPLEHATLLGRPLQTWLLELDIVGQQDDIWDGPVHTLRHARIFSRFLLPNSGVAFSGDDKQTASWKASKKLSISEISSLKGSLPAEFSWRRSLSFETDMSIVHTSLCDKRDVCLLEIFSRCARNAPIQQALEWMDDIAERVATAIEQEPEGTVPYIGRVLSAISDLLAAYSGNKGGLRSGPARNPAFQEAFQLLYQGRYVDGLQAMRVQRDKWLATVESIARAARHYEGACQAVTRRMVETVQVTMTSSSSKREQGVWVEVEAPARIDLAGGWTDTPPITYEHGGCVTNMAIQIDGKCPIKAKCRKISQPIIILHVAEGGQPVVCSTKEELADYARPMAPAALLKACVVCLNVLDLTERAPSLSAQLTSLGGGLELHTSSDLPTGSGLGTSSILAGVILEAVADIMGRAFDPQALIHAVLKVEQMLTTGGGWQDQVGGLLPGIKLSYSKPHIPLTVRYEIATAGNTPESHASFLKKLESHFCLIYTGRTRLARDLLQDVLRRWYSKTPEILDVTDALVQNAHDMHAAIKKEDIQSVGKELSKYWHYKKIMASGAEPPSVTRMLSLVSSHIWGASLTGAGGGGFMVLVTQHPNDHANIEKVLKEGLGEDASQMTFHKLAIDTVGLAKKYTTAS
eukprot:TRINITY_DN3158_c0_g1_i5.p1 TRINITY_DN3158_c0_g1~~TRINITY_DN3158_c0_g1_i5.p1  ORF type:complete len:896 (+),score=116.44 TRINITY_DN3158_c0_g1_i5:2-2689(+)